MKVVSDRVSVLKKDDLISVVILPSTDRKKMLLLFLWLLAWTVCGVLVFANYFKLTNQNEKLFVIVYLSFWLYFEINIARTFIWRRWGKEKIWIQKGELYYQRELNGKGKVHAYSLDLISELTLIPIKETRFADFVSQSFWEKGTARLEFRYTGKTRRFGMQISDFESKAIQQELNAFIAKKSGSDGH
jgi:hypothetical protein